MAEPAAELRPAGDADKYVEKDYDAAVTAKPFRAVVKGELLEYPPEAPLDVAIGWMDRMAVGSDKLGETTSQYMVGNYETVIGKSNLAAVREKGAGSETLGQLYLDLLVHWKLMAKPGENQESEVDAMLDQLEVIAVRGLTDSDDRIEHASIITLIRERIPALTPDEPVTGDDENPS